MVRLRAIEKIIYATLIAAVICLAGGGLIFHFQEGLAIFAGAVWGSLNLFFLKHLIQNLLLRTGKNIKLFMLVCIKWPLLYLAGYALLKIDYLSSLYLLIGFSISIGMLFIFGIAGALKSYEK